MHEHDHAESRDGSRPPAAPAARPAPAALALQRAAGNRAMNQVLSRMEASEAVDRLEQALGAGVMGAEQQVVDTLQTFSHDAGGFDKVSADYEKKTEQPLVPSLPEAAQALQPDGWYPGISGEGG